MSGSDTGLATSGALCAIASVIRRSGEKPGESGKPGQRQGGGEGAARDDQRFAPGLARITPKDSNEQSCSLA